MVSSCFVVGERLLRLVHPCCYTGAHGIDNSIGGAKGTKNRLRTKKFFESGLRKNTRRVAMFIGAGTVSKAAAQCESSAASAECRRLSININW